MLAKGMRVSILLKADWEANDDRRRMRERIEEQGKWVSGCVIDGLMRRGVRPADDPFEVHRPCLASIWHLQAD